MKVLIQTAGMRAEILSRYFPNSHSTEMSGLECFQTYTLNNICRNVPVQSVIISENKLYGNLTWLTPLCWIQWQPVSIRQTWYVLYLIHVSTLNVAVVRCCFKYTLCLLNTYWFFTHYRSNVELIRQRFQPQQRQYRTQIDTLFCSVVTLVFSNLLFSSGCFWAFKIGDHLEN